MKPAAVVWLVPVAIATASRRQLVAPANIGPGPYCCCNVGYKFDYSVDECVKCTTPSTETIGPASEPNRFHPIALDDYHSAEQAIMEDDCADNAPIPYTWTFKGLMAGNVSGWHAFKSNFYCGEHGHTCAWPSYCCCMQGTEYDPVDQTCKPCAGADGVCADGIAIAETKNWPNCHSQDEKLYPCFLPYAHQGPVKRNFCCCQPGFRWNGDKCAEAPEEYLGHIIDGSDEWWSCGTTMPKWLRSMTPKLGHEYPHVYICADNDLEPTYWQRFPLLIIIGVIGGALLFCASAATFFAWCLRLGAAVRTEPEEETTLMVDRSYPSPRQ
jgi:hypothetical protein